jgi:hypothetical protein
MQTSVFFDGFHFSAIAIGLQEAFQINRQALLARTIPRVFWLKMRLSLYIYPPTIPNEAEAEVLPVSFERHSSGEQNGFGGMERFVQK